MHSMRAKMGRFIIFSLLLIGLIIGSQIHEAKAYSVSFDSELASLIIKQLPNEWYFSFSGYETSINSGIASASDINVTLYYTPKNASGPLIYDAQLAYNDMVAQLNKSDIKSAAVAFGRLVGYSVYLSNPFRTTDMKNSTLAQSFEAMIVDSDINDISIYKNITVSDVPTALASIGIKAVNLASILNKTAISKEQRDENYTKFISIMLSYTASVIYALFTKAI